jgi:uncharacterized protein (TIGR01777 family)
MKLLVTGATGLIGKKIIGIAKKRNIMVHFLSTRKHKLIDSVTLKGFYWNPQKDEIDYACFEGVDTLIHLAGASISKMWTTKNKKEILESRVKGSRLLKKALDRQKIKMKSIICASAVGIYPNSLDVVYEEKSHLKQHSNFLQNVTFAWERESRALTDHTQHLSLLRIGLVLAKEGGLLSQLTLPVKLFSGTAFASGKQWQSWIHIDDLSRLFFKAIDQGWEGTYNAVAPNPVSQIDMIKAIGKTLSRPVFLPNIPAFLIKMVMGERSILILGSQKVSAELILSKGFEFHFPFLLQALKNVYTKKE